MAEPTGIQHIFNSPTLKESIKNAISQIDPDDTPRD